MSPSDRWWANGQGKRCRCKTCGVVHLGPGLHYVQEDHPEAIGSNLHKWLTELEVADTRPEGARRSGTEAA